MNFDLNNWKTLKMAGDIIVDFYGSMQPNCIDELLATIENKLNDTSEVENVKKKVLHVFVECIQNLFHHVESTDEAYRLFGNEKFCGIALSHEGSFYRISTGNIINQEKIQAMEKRIDNINSLTEDEVKMLYRDTLYNKGFSEKGGGGMGIIDIARKTGNKILYKMYDLPNSEKKFFSLDIYVS